MGKNFDERLANWKKNEGKNLDERAIKAFFEVIKLDLQKEEKLSGLSLEEKADLTAIVNYLDADKEPKLRASELEIIFNVDVDIPENTVKEWRNYDDKKKDSIE